MSFTVMQMMAVLGAGGLLGIAGLMALAGALAARHDDREGGCFARAVALLAAGAGLALLVSAVR